MRKGKVYVVYGSNAVMLSRDWDQAVFCRDRYFLSPCVIKKYDCLTQAEEEAIDHLWEITPYGKMIPERLDVGKVYAARKLPDL